MLQYAPEVSNKEALGGLVQKWGCWQGGRENGPKCERKRYQNKPYVRERLRVKNIASELIKKGASKSLRYWSLEFSVCYALHFWNENTSSIPRNTFCFFGQIKCSWSLCHLNGLYYSDGITETWSKPFFEWSEALIKFRKSLWINECLIMAQVKLIWLFILQIAYK